MIDTSKLNYRKSVIGIIIGKQNKFLITQLVNYGDNEWKFPGGGLEENETSEEALIRELHEELGTDKFKIIKKSQIQNKYDWPMDVIKMQLKKKGKTYKGQIQDQYLVHFEGSDIDIKMDPSEIKKIKWVDYLELSKHLNFPNQWKVAKTTIADLLPKIENDQHHLA